MKLSSISLIFALIASRVASYLPYRNSSPYLINSSMAVASCPSIDSLVFFTLYIRFSRAFQSSRRISFSRLSAMDSFALCVMPSISSGVSACCPSILISSVSPSVVSVAETVRSPLPSISKITRMSFSPFGFGGILSSNLPS